MNTSPAGEDQEQGTVLGFGLAAVILVSIIVYFIYMSDRYPSDPQRRAI
jgi:hypothetical protein